MITMLFPPPAADHHPFLHFPLLFSIASFFLLFPVTFCAEPCPLFGDSQCPEGFHCVLDKCEDEKGMEAPSNCAKINCGKEAECREGKCIRFSGRPCGRNLLVAEGVARAVVSDCGGAQGRCMGGRCTVDKCADVLCDEMSELCRDGICMSLSSLFCFSPFDCGPPSLFECSQNKCKRRKDTVAPALTAPEPKCDPGEVIRGGRCVVQEGCAQLVCPSGQSCYHGFCIPSSPSSSASSSPSASSSASVCAHSGDCADAFLCRDGRCMPDICKANGGKCLPEHACSPMSIPEGECRHYQGLLCSNLAAIEDCPPPFFCIGGICAKDECYRKVCQIGERCDGGLCIRVEGTPCRDAIKDCGEHFACDAGICKDKMEVHAPAAAAERRGTTTMAPEMAETVEGVGGGGSFGIGK